MSKSNANVLQVFYLLLKNLLPNMFKGSLKEYFFFVSRDCYDMLGLADI